MRRKARTAPPPPGKAGRECAEDGCGARVRPAIRGPNQRLVGDVLPVKRGCMHSVVGYLLGVHCRSAFLPRVQSVGARYANFKEFKNAISHMTFQNRSEFLEKVKFAKMTDPAPLCGRT